MRGKSLLLGMLFICLGYTGMAQKLNDKNSVVVIKTSAQCEMCEERIMSELNMHKGVRKIEFNLPTKEVTITYNAVKTSEEDLREAISEIGYSADDILAADNAYEKLPSCCKKPADR
ncbi:MAG: heavy-metal-associated domain-containing protein [Flavobacteriales bacterium]|nr:heavy-metal-associated domain-containing protein [Flavobacteriales bacterium]